VLFLKHQIEVQLQYQVNIQHVCILFFLLKFSFYFIFLNQLVSPHSSSIIIPPVLSTIPATIININPTLPGERHISFAVNKENDSNESNHTALLMNDDDGVIITDGNSTTGNIDRRSKIFKDSLLLFIIILIF